MQFKIQFQSTTRLLKHYLLLLFFLPAILSFQTAQKKEKNQHENIPKSANLPSPLIAEVIGIQDGDTIEMKFIFTGKKAGVRANKPVRIRFMHVNTPERGKPFYKVASQFTSEKCFRKTVEIRHEGNFDRYGRLIGEVILANGLNLNKELVRKGYAIHYKRFSKSAEYAKLETTAKSKKLGIWGTPESQLSKL